MNKYTFRYIDVTGATKSLEIYAVTLQNAADQYQLAQLEAEKIWYGEDKFVPDFVEWTLVSVLDHGITKNVVTI